jgi:hypothetical protein
MFFSIHQINYSIHISCVSLSEISYAKKKDMGYAKKRKSMPRGVREKGQVTE